MFLVLVLPAYLGAMPHLGCNNHLVGGCLDELWGSLRCAWRPERKSLACFVLLLLGSGPSTHQSSGAIELFLGVNINAVSHRERDERNGGAELNIGILGVLQCFHFCLLLHSRIKKFEKHQRPMKPLGKILVPQARVELATYRLGGGLRSYSYKFIKIHSHTLTSLWSKT